MAAPILRLQHRSGVNRGEELVEYEPLKNFDQKYQKSIPSHRRETNAARRVILRRLK